MAIIMNDNVGIIATDEHNPSITSIKLNALIIDKLQNSLKKRVEYLSKKTSLK